MGVLQSKSGNLESKEVQEFVIDVLPLMQLKHELNLKLNFRQKYAIKNGQQVDPDNPDQVIVEKGTLAYQSPLKDVHKDYGDPILKADISNEISSRLQPSILQENALREAEDAGSNSSNSMADLCSMMDLQQQQKVQNTNLQIRKQPSHQLHVSSHNSSKEDGASNGEKQWVQVGLLDTIKEEQPTPAAGEIKTRDQNFSSKIKRHNNVSSELKDQKAGFVVKIERDAKVFPLEKLDSPNEYQKSLDLLSVPPRDDMKKTLSPKRQNDADVQSQKNTNSVVAQSQQKQFQNLNSNTNDQEYTENVIGTRMKQDKQHFYEIMVSYRFLESFRVHLQKNDLWNHYKKTLSNGQQVLDRREQINQIDSLTSTQRRNVKQNLKNTVYLKVPMAGSLAIRSQSTKIGEKGSGKDIFTLQNNNQNSKQLIAMKQSSKLRELSEKKQKTRGMMDVVNTYGGISASAAQQEKQKNLIEQNMLAATWINDMTMPERHMDPRKIFYNNETLLLKGNLRSHFNKKNVKKFYEYGQEFICLKGNQLSSKGPSYDEIVEEIENYGDQINKQKNQKQEENHGMNKDSFFSIIDGNGAIKIIGLFQGHGLHGHSVSSAAMCIMLDYLRNKNDVFKSKNLENLKAEDVKKEIQKAFLYTQHVLREDFEIIRCERKLQKANKQKQAQFEKQQELMKNNTININEQVDFTGSQKFDPDKFKNYLNSKMRSRVNKTPDNDNARLKNNLNDQESIDACRQILKGDKNKNEKVEQVGNHLKFGNQNQINENGNQSRNIDILQKGTLGSSPSLRSKSARISQRSGQSPEAFNHIQGEIKEIKFEKLQIKKINKQKKPTSPRADSIWTRTHKNLQQRMEQLMKEIQIKEYNIKDTQSEWEDDTNIGDICNDKFDTQMFLDDQDEEDKDAKLNLSLPKKGSKAKRFEYLVDRLQSSYSNLRIHNHYIHDPEQQKVNTRKYIHMLRIKKELIIRQRLLRQVNLNRDKELKFINGRPELRFRVMRPSFRKYLRHQIRLSMADRFEKWKYQKRKEKVRNQSIESKSQYPTFRSQNISNFPNRKNSQIFMKINTIDIEDGFQQLSDLESSSEMDLTETSSSNDSQYSRYHFSQDSEQREIEEQQDFDFIMNREELMQENVKFTDEYSSFSSQGDQNDSKNEESSMSFFNVDKQASQKKVQISNPKQ